MKEKISIVTLMIISLIAFVGCQTISPVATDRQVNDRIENCRKGDALLKLFSPDGKPLMANMTVRIEQTRHAFLFGSNINWLVWHSRFSHRYRRAYCKYFAELFNFATFPFYWWSFSPGKDEVYFRRHERIAQWCKVNAITPKGHPLAWNWQDPKWLQGTPEEVMEEQFAYIDHSVRQFKNSIQMWDVVNEATEWDRPKTRKDAPLLTKAVQNMGVKDYICQAFRVARKANPDATLIINDYRTNSEYARYVINKLVDDNGLPLYDVIGLQFHQHLGALPISTIWYVCNRFARFGKPLHLTEVTFLSGREGWELGEGNPRFIWESTPKGEKRQAEDVVRFYTAMFSHPAVEAITWWDFTDLRSWQGAPGGLLREDMSPKPAYYELKRLIKEKWWTRTKAITTVGGEAHFRGFFGQYKVSVTSGARQLTGTFWFDKNTKGPIDVHLE
jgi:endo-1,4-beta-xylanase